jgi:hypothetical protein
MHFRHYFARRERGIARFRLHRYSEAIRDLQKSLASAPTGRAKFYLNKARAARLRQTRADTEAPRISLSPGLDRKVCGTRRVQIEGHVSDDRYVASVAVGGKSLFIELARDRVDFKEEVRVAMPGVAASGLNVAGGDVAADNVAPRIQWGLPGGTETLRTTQESLFVDGEVRDPAGIVSLRVNGEPLPLPGSENRYVIFNYLVPLRMKENTVKLTAVDRHGNRAIQTRKVYRRESEIHSVSARYSVGLVPMEDIGPVKEKAGEVYAYITTALSRTPRRFYLVERRRERMEQILLEHKLSQMANKQTAIRLGKLVSAEGMLFGELSEGRDYLTIFLRLVDTERGHVLYPTDVYGEDKKPPAIRHLARGLVSKLEANFPLTSGKVLRRDGGEIRVDLGRRDALREGMKLLFYKPDEAGILKDTEILKVDDKPVQGTVEKVGTATASARLQRDVGASLLEKGDKVITK